MSGYKIRVFTNSAEGLFPLPNCVIINRMIKSEIDDIVERHTEICHRIESNKTNPDRHEDVIDRGSFIYKRFIRTF